jgi:hypothetical protein
MPVQAIADVNDTKLLVLPLKILLRHFNEREQEKFLMSSVINFPN